MSTETLRTFLNIQRNEYLGSLAKTQLFWKRANDAQKIGKKISDLIDEQTGGTSAVTEGVRALELDKFPISTEEITIVAGYKSA